jgi:hypothetical protein
MVDLEINARGLNVFKSTFKNKDVRSIFIDDRRYFNSTDFLKFFVEEKAVATLWGRLRAKHATIADAAKEYTFAGGRPTPVVPIETLVEIIWHVPGRNKDDVKRACARLFIMQFNPDPELVAMIDNRLQATENRQMSGEIRESPEDSIFDLPTTSTKSRGAYNQTMGYIRIRLPEEHVVDHTTAKEISSGVIKFGITYSLRDRDVKYNEDNGFMAYSYSFENRWEASMTEQLLRHEFRDITCYDSKEYLNADALAKQLGCEDYSSDMYASYTELARRLFARMVSIAKTIWPEKYRELHGYVYKIKMREVKPTQTIISPDGSIGRPTSQMEYDFPCTRIDNTMASEMGLVDPNTQISDQLARQHVELTLCKAELAVCKAELAAARTSTPTTSTTTPGAVPIVYPNAEEMPPPRFGKARSHGVIIGRNLKTGEDLKYASAERAASQCGMTPASFRRSVVNRKRQLAGCHWRSEGLAIWVPPEGFVYDGHFDASSTNMNFIVATKEQGTSGAEPERKIFESITVAARILDLDRRKLTDFVAMKRAYGGYVWNTLDMDQCGTMIEDVAASTRVPNAAEDAGVSLRCAGRVVELELATGKEVVHDSVTRAAAMIGISALTVREQLLDKPRQAFGRVFRSYVSTSRWQPPDNFVFDASKYVKTGGYVKSVDKDGAEKLYESVWEASRILGFHKSAIQQVINTDKVSTQLGLKWKRPEESDFLHMVPCTPPPLEKT